MGHPKVYPTGATLYNPEKCFNGYTLFQARELGAMLIDMNGREVKLWKNLAGFPNKLLPGGQVFGHTGERAKAYGYQDQLDLVQVDWEGNIVWKFDRWEKHQDGDEPERWMARQHHDYQREGNPVGYYVPGMEPIVEGGKSLVLCHTNKTVSEISDKKLLDDVILEVDWEGNILWKWEMADHYDEIGFSAEEKQAIYNCPSPVKGLNVGDWAHINCASYLGANKWYDAGDERFHPDNIIIDSRTCNFMAIISKETGRFVWKLGPDYTSEPASKINVLIGMHHSHLIPKGLPGEGNILVFDNGGWAGYGIPDINSADGTKKAKRDYSRILEFNPITFDIVWQFTPKEYGKVMPFLNDHFYSPYISSAQRLPNGNTLICEGNNGHLLEVTVEHEVVWEYISPYWGPKLGTNMVYRAYRYPYEYIPQEPKPEEVEIAAVDVKQFRMPGAAPMGTVTPTKVDGVQGYVEVAGFCVNTED